MRRQLLTGLVMTLAFTVVCGLLYPLAVFGVSQVAMKDKANGSIVSANGQAVGSSLIGQTFTQDQYFWPRPSAGDGYDAAASSGSNLGPSNEKLIGQCYPVPKEDESGTAITYDQGNAVNETNPDGTPICDPNTVPQRVAAYRQANGLDANTAVPVDAVTASGSGLDPHISVANARLQAARVAKARTMPLDQVNSAIDAHTDARSLGFLGEPGVNVLELNVGLDQATSG